MKLFRKHSLSKYYNKYILNRDLNFWILVPVAFSFVAAIMWYKYLSFIEDGIPRGDELNFYYPWAKSFAENPSFKSFMLPHSEHPQLLYKLFTLYNSFVGRYDLGYYQWLSPIILFLYAVFFAFKSIRSQVNFIWALFSIFLVLAVMSPFRHGQMAYEMISVIGILGPMFMLYLIDRFEKILNGGGVKKYEIAHFVVIGFAAQNTTIKIFIIPFLVATLIWVLMRLKFNKKIIPMKVFLVCFFCFGLLIFQDVLMSFAGYDSSVEGLSIDFTMTIAGVLESTKLIFSGYPIAGGDMLFGFLYFSVMGGLFFLLIKKDEVAAAALIGIPVVAAIATLNLRGMVAAPRYQGLFIFYQIVPIYAGVVCFQRYTVKSRKMVLGGLVSCFCILMIVKDVHIYSKLNSSKGSAVKYYELSRSAFFSVDTFSKSELKNFACFRPATECIEMINEIQNQRGMNWKRQDDEKK